MIIISSFSKIIAPWPVILEAKVGCTMGTENCLFLCVALLNRVMCGSFKQGNRHYIYTIVNIIEELKEKYNYGKS